MQTTKTLPLRKKIILVFLGITVFFLLLEAGLRGSGFVLISLQERRNLESLRQKGAYRILCLGESTTAGGRDSYPAYLEQILNGRNLGVRFSVINKGSVGVTSSYLLAQLEANLNTYNPDMVIVMMGINDSGQSHMPVETFHPSGSIPFWESFKTYKLFRLIGMHFQAKKKAGLSVERDRVTQEPVAPEIPDLETPPSEKECFELGQVYRSQGKYLQAEAMMRRGMEIDPASDRCAVVLGQCLQEEGKKLAAAEMFMKTLELNPRNDWGYVGMGWYYKDEGMSDKSEDMFKKAIALNPHNYNAYFGLGVLYDTPATCSQAEEMLKKSLDIDPTLDYVYPVLGNLYALEGRNEEAEKVFKQAIRMHPEKESLYIDFGQFSQSRGKNKQAEELYLKAIEINPGNNWSYVILGQLYQLEKKYDQAMKVYQTALQVNPRNDRVTGALAVLCEIIRKDPYARKYCTRCDGQRRNYYSSILRDNYLRLKGILDARRIKFVCVQYPLRGLEELEKMFEPKQKGIIFVDNEKKFKDAVAKTGYGDFFKDMFAGDFGHCTSKGNRLLAENIAGTIVNCILREKTAAY